VTIAEAHAILSRWDRRQPGERKAVLEADKLLQKGWPKRRAEWKARRPVYQEPLVE